MNSFVIEAEVLTRGVFCLFCFVFLGLYKKFKPGELLQVTCLPGGARVWPPTAASANINHIRELTSLQWKSVVLTNGPPGNSQNEIS